MSLAKHRLGSVAAAVITAVMAMAMIVVAPLSAMADVEGDPPRGDDQQPSDPNLDTPQSSDEIAAPGTLKQPAAGILKVLTPTGTQDRQDVQDLPEGYTFIDTAPDGVRVTKRSGFCVPR